MAKELFNLPINANPALTRRLAHGTPDDPGENMTIGDLVTLINGILDGRWIVYASIGVWNMDANDSKTIYFADIDVDYSKVRHVTASIYPDSTGPDPDKYAYDLKESGDVAWGITTTDGNPHIKLTRNIGGYFDMDLYNSIEENRGYLIFHLVP